MPQSLIDLALRVGLIVLGLVVGSKLPDLDLAPVLPLRHRSIWTHGPLLPALLLWASAQTWWAWWLIVGILPTMMLHHLADCFPKHWRGSATVKMFPLSFALNPLLSFVWIALGVWACGYSFWLLAGAHVLYVVSTVRGWVGL